MTEKTNYKEMSAKSYENPLDDDVTLEKLINTANDLGGMTIIRQNQTR
jgi:hypothetical protein